MTIQTESYDTIFEQYTSTIQWMRNLGIKLDLGRTSHYEKILRHWKDSYKTANHNEVKVNFPDFVSSMFEIFDFVNIHVAFKDMPHDQLEFIINKLQKGVNGPINAVDESPESSAARNFLFEASVAARAHHPEMGIEAILDATSDTGIRIDKKNIWIECKRVTTTEKLEGNIRKASSQLEMRLARDIATENRGIVAIDISKILNRGDQIFVARNDNELVEKVDFLMDQFITQHSQIWQRIYKRRHKKVIGTIFRFAFMASSEARNILVHTSQWAINPRADISNTDTQIQQKIVSILARPS